MNEAEIKTIYNRKENTVYLLNDFGTAGLESRYIDEHTFVGLETYSLEGKTFPETFDLEISISKFVPEISFGENPFQKNGARGRWNFDIPVTVNSADIQTIAVHAKKNEHPIDTVVVSPIMITIYTSYPDLYFNTVNYDVLCYTNVLYKQRSHQNPARKSHRQSLSRKCFLSIDIFIRLW